MSETLYICRDNNGVEESDLVLDTNGSSTVVDGALTMSVSTSSSLSPSSSCPETCIGLEACNDCHCAVPDSLEEGGTGGKVVDLLLCLLPILFLLAATLKKEPMATTKSLPMAAVLMFLVRLMYLQSDPLLTCGSVLLGLHEALSPLAIMLGAILLFETMEVTYCMPYMMRELKGLTDGHPVAELMIIFAFTYMLEGGAGFGTPVALGSAMAVSLGFPKFESVVVLLVFNAFATVWGAAGTPIWVGFGNLENVSEAYLLKISNRSSICVAVAAYLVIPILLVYLIPPRTIRENWLFIMLSISSCVLPNVALSNVSYELPSLIGGMIGCTLTGFFIQGQIGLKEVPMVADSYGRHPMDLNSVSRQSIVLELGQLADLAELLDEDDLDDDDDDDEDTKDGNKSGLDGGNENTSSRPTEDSTGDSDPQKGMASEDDDDHDHHNKTTNLGRSSTGGTGPTLRASFVTWGEEDVVVVEDNKKEPAEFPEPPRKESWNGPSNSTLKSILRYSSSSSERGDVCSDSFRESIAKRRVSLVECGIPKEEEEEEEEEEEKEEEEEAAAVFQETFEEDDDNVPDMGNKDANGTFENGSVNGVGAIAAAEAGGLATVVRGTKRPRSPFSLDLEAGASPTRRGDDASQRSYLESAMGIPLGMEVFFIEDSYGRKRESHWWKGEGGGRGPTSPKGGSTNAAADVANLSPVRQPHHYAIGGGRESPAVAAALAAKVLGRGDVEAPLAASPHAAPPVSPHAAPRHASPLAAPRHASPLAAPPFAAPPFAAPVIGAPPLVAANNGSGVQESPTGRRSPFHPSTAPPFNQSIPISPKVPEPPPPPPFGAEATAFPSLVGTKIPEADDEQQHQEETAVVQEKPKPPPAPLPPLIDALPLRARAMSDGSYSGISWSRRRLILGGVGNSRSGLGASGASFSSIGRESIFHDEHDSFRPSVPKKQPQQQQQHHHHHHNHHHHNHHHHHHHQHAQDGSSFSPLRFRQEQPPTHFHDRRRRASSGASNGSVSRRGSFFRKSTAPAPVDTVALRRSSHLAILHVLGPRKSWGDAGHLKEMFARTFPITGTVLLLVLTRVPQVGIKNVVTSTTPNWFTLPLGTYGTLRLSAGLVLQLDHILAYPNLNWKFELLYVPFLLPFVVISAITWLYFRKDCSISAFSVLRTVVGRLEHPAIAVMGAMSLAQLMIAGGEASPASIIGTTLSDFMGAAWIPVTAYIGVLGAFFSGSMTVSNLTFGQIHRVAAQTIGTSETAMLALQSCGGTAGNGVSLHNIIAAATCVGLVGPASDTSVNNNNQSTRGGDVPEGGSIEGRIIAKTWKPVFLFAFITTVVTVALFFRF